jgi:hypothetical protein
MGLPRGQELAFPAQEVSRRGAGERPEEESGAWATALEDALEVPLTTTVLGVEVIVTGLETSGHGELLALCVAGKHCQRIALTDLPRSTSGRGRMGRGLPTVEPEQVIVEQLRGRRGGVRLGWCAPAVSPSRRTHRPLSRSGGCPKHPALPSSFSGGASAFVGV